MQYVGFLLIALALLALVIGIVQRGKGKKILAAPFRKTGEIAQNPSVADAKGVVSCEGAVAVQQPVLAPCSGKPCIYYEVEVFQEWSKTVVTENGTKTEKGSTSVQIVKSGAVFFLNDGSGHVAVDPREGMQVELDKSFEQEQAVAWGDAIFGQFRAHVPPSTGDKRGHGVKVVEKIVPPQGNLFVLGQLRNQAIGRPQGMLGSLLASRKGRDALLGGTKRNATLGFVAAAVMVLPGAGLSIFADPPAASTACNIVDESKPGTPCTGTITTDRGESVPLTVTQAGSFKIDARAPAGKKIPLDALVTVKDALGTVMAANVHGTTKLDLAAGTYTVEVKDSIPGAAKAFKGGFSFELSVTRLAGAVPVTSALVAGDAVAPSAAGSGKPAVVPPVAKAATTAAGGIKPSNTSPASAKPGTDQAPIRR